MKMLLSGIVGSTAYGLAGPDSDVDRLGVYAAPTIDLHGLHPPLDKQATVVLHEPGDATYHEALKFANLCLGGNPTLTELLFLDSYEVETELGRELVAIRSAFLSAPRVRDAYYGYATAQFKRLLATGQFASKQRARVAKHARHMLRLLDQGLELYTTGHLTIRVADPQRCLEFGERVAEDPEAAGPALAEAEAKFNAARSPLPDKPNTGPVEKWLHRVRAAHMPHTVTMTLPEPPRPYVPPVGKPTAMLVDVDGTVALRGDRGPFDWARVGEDLPNHPVIAMVRALAREVDKVIFVSGRPDECYDTTAAWLAQHVYPPTDGLIMRQTGDHRIDALVKLEIFDRELRDNLDVRYAVDDRNQVVSMWRALGIPTLQVADGNF